MAGYLCVGGPKDGDVIDVSPSVSRVQLPEMISTLSASWEKQSEDFPTSMRVFTYTKQSFSCGSEADVTFLVPEGQSPIKTLTMLSDLYKRHYDET